MKTIYLSGKEFTYNKISELSKELTARHIILGDRCEIGYRCNIGYRCKIGNECNIGNGCNISNWCDLGNGCKIGDECNIGNECELKETPFYSLGLYKYVTGAYISKGEAWIQMGCYLRTLKEWEDDFWNNTKEFPNDNSPKSRARLFAFKTAKKWIKFNT